MTDDASGADVREIQALPSCLVWGGVMIDADGTQRGLEDFETLPVVIPLWAAMPEHDDDTVRLCTEFAVHPHPAVREAAIRALDVIAARRR